MLTFTVEGPFAVPTYEGKVARIVDDEALSSFWIKCGMAESRGCYIFGVQASKGFKPVYVGRATRNFKQEAFAPHKLEKYQRCLADLVKGTPVMFFVVLPVTRGKTNIKAIRELEDY